MRGKARLFQANEVRHASKDAASSTSGKAAGRAEGDEEWVDGTVAAKRDLQSARAKFAVACGADHVVLTQIEAWLRACELALKSVKSVK